MAAEDGIRYLDKRIAEMPRTVDAMDVWPEFEQDYDHGPSRGDAPQWASFAKLFTVAPGQVTTITGYPNSGKSQFTDALCLGLARDSGWRFVMCSLENLPVRLHVEKLVKQYVGLPTREGPTPRMTKQQAQDAFAAIRDWFRFVVPTEQKPNPSVQDVMEVIEADFKRMNLWGVKDARLACVIDPWNELEHFRPRGVSLTEYVGESLSRIRQWARQRMLHVFIVAHPAKQYRSRDANKLPVVTPDMISDSAHFWNKSDNCITVALKDQGHNTPFVEIHVQKVRFSHIGRQGHVELKFDVVSGRYEDCIQPHWTGSL